MSDQTATAVAEPRDPKSLKFDGNNTRDKRKKGDEAFAALVASIKEHGVLQPVIVRPSDDVVVVGHGRTEACIELGIPVPVVYQEVADDDLVTVRIVENVQRRDMTPMEESDAFAVLEKRGVSVEEIATRTSLSIVTIERRLALQNLPAKVKTALRAGKISTFIGGLIALIPDSALQLAALEYATTPDNWRNELPSDRTVAEKIRREYMTALKNAVFDTNDATLIERRGACSSCTLNSACKPVLFDGLAVEEKGICSDRSCFDEKSEATVAKVIADLEAGGVTVLDGRNEDHAKEVGRVISYGKVAHDAPWIETSYVPRNQPKDGKRQLKTLLGKDAPPVTAFIDGETRKSFECFPALDAGEALRAKYKWAREATKHTRMAKNAGKTRNAKEASQAAQHRLKKKRENAAREAVIDAVCMKMEEAFKGRKVNEAWDVMLVECLLAVAMTSESATAVIKSFELGDPKESYAPHILRDAVEKATPQFRIRYAIANVVHSRLWGHYDPKDGEGSRVVKMLELLGVDALAIMAEVTAAQDAEQKAKAAAKREREKKKAEREKRKAEKAAAGDNAPAEKPVKKRAAPKKTATKKTARKRTTKKATASS